MFIVAQQLMLSDDGTILAELDMRLTEDQFSNLYEQPSKFMYVKIYITLIQLNNFSILQN